MGIFLELEKIALAILIWQTLTIFDNIFRNLRVDISCGLSAIRMSGLILHENLNCHKICLVGCTWRFKGLVENGVYIWPPKTRDMKSM